MQLEEPLVSTIKEKCRMCYACVRECPAKAIRILDGQASVVPDRCIGCGNCVRVCSQNAKQVLSDVATAFALLASTDRVAAIVAPSFPAEFTDLQTSQLVGMIGDLGFDSVHEVAFGADMVAREYARLLQSSARRHITTTCPAVVSYVRKYHPALMPALVPLVSPMVATARALRARYGDELRIVFIGPCIAKKGEAAHDEIEGEVDAVLTFVELRQMFRMRNVAPRLAEPERESNAPLPASPFDPPYPGLGSLFPLSRGLLQAATLREDLLEGDIVTADGRDHFVQAIEDFEAGASGIRLLDILCCQGCIMGVGMSSTEPIFRRRAQVSHEARERVATFDREAWERQLEEFADVDMRRSFSVVEPAFNGEPTQEELEPILQRMNKFEPEDHLNCGACGYESCLDHATAIYKGLAEVEMCLPATVEHLRSTVRELEESHRSLESTREALVKSEKLASMGQLAAGIAHEVNNPLGILLLQANIVLEECEEQSELVDDLSLIVDQANRCKRIIAGLLNFARQSRVVRQPTDIPALVGDVLRTIPFDDNVTVRIDDEMRDPIAEIDADQIVQVMVNLITNAQQAMPDGGLIRIGLEGTDDEITITVTDTGCGIPKENLSKLYTPFFTTKQVGKGTGLGLPVTHGIVKMHRGSIDVRSNADPSAGPTETTFVVKLPRREL